MLAVVSFLHGQLGQLVQREHAVMAPLHPHRLAAKADKLNGCERVARVMLSREAIQHAGNLASQSAVPEWKCLQKIVRLKSAIALPRRKEPSTANLVVALHPAPDRCDQIDEWVRARCSCGLLAPFDRERGFASHHM